MKKARALSREKFTKMGNHSNSFHSNVKKALCNYNPSYNSFKNFVYADSTNPMEIIADFCSLSKTKKSLDDILFSFYSIALKLGYNYITFSMPDINAELINIKTIDSQGNIYTEKESTDNTNHYLVQIFNDKSRKLRSNSNFLNIYNLFDSYCITIPMTLDGECLGLITAGYTSKENCNHELLNTLCNYLTLIISNLKLRENIDSYTEVDRLTKLQNYNEFNKALKNETYKAATNNTNLAVAIFDLNNVTEINKKLGHAEGDKLIKIFSEFIKNSLRENDTAYRYGCDEIAVIMPDTDIKKACQIAEDINKQISSYHVKEIGYLSSSTGVSSYPSCTTCPEKLSIMAEQAMLISKSKKDEQDIQLVISSENVNFWDKQALKALANVITKRHFQWGVNFEEELLNQIHDKNVPLKNNVEIVKSLAGAIDAKDTYTRGHSQSVSNFAEKLARAINLPEETVERIKLAALLHDVGKIGISESILRKPGALTDQEWEIMKQHPTIAVKKILEPIPVLKDLIPIIKHHHERIDGCGYPDALKGHEIPLGAKIVAIADAFHALISHRPYRKAMSVEKAINILKSGAGTQWDKDLIRKFIAIAPDLI